MPTSDDHLYIGPGPSKQSRMLTNRWALVAVGLFLCRFSFDLSAASNTTNTLAPSNAPYTIDVWQTDDGLPQNSVISMTQSRDGYLWLGTLNGLVRFDGIRFTVFDESNTPGLNSGGIVKLFEDSQGNLWIGTETAGIAVVKEGRVANLGIGRGRESCLAAVCEDASGAVWLYAKDGQLWRYSVGSTNGFLVGADGPSDRRTLIAEDSGLVWVGTDRRLLAIRPTPARKPSELPVELASPVERQLDFLLASRRGGYWRLADGRIQRCSTNRVDRDYGAYPWSGVTVTSACEDLQGNLLVGTSGAGVYWFDADGQATGLSTANGLSHNYILSLHVDREGSLWVGTDGGGLNRVKRQLFEVIEESRGLVVQSVCEDDQGGLWIGSNGGGAFYWKDGVRQFDLGRMPVWSVFVDRDRRVWAGTRGLGLYQMQASRFQPAAGSTLIDREITAIHQDRSGRIWLGTRGGLARRDEREWKVFTTQDGLSSDEVTSIADDAEGNLWVGTRGGGLNRLRNGKFESLRNQDGLPAAEISSLYVDADGALWIGSRGNGLTRRQGSKWTSYTTRDGLISNSVGYLIEDGHGFLWIGSNAGLMRVPKKSLNDFADGLTNLITCRAFRKADGLPTRECTQGSQPGACRTRDGKLWFPTIKGLVSVNPAKIAPNTNPPPVMIESVLVEGREQNTNALRTAWLQSVTVPAGEGRLEIHFTSLNLAAPERARFKYRLEEHETTWIESGDTRIARYSRLPPGRYRFVVTAANEDDVWNPTGSAFAVIVEPPFWQTWWFLLIATAVVLGWIIGIVHYLSTQRLQRQLEGLRQQQAIEKERSRIARDIHDQLGASLTQVSLLGELVESDKDSAEEVVAHARQISQTALDTTRTLDEIVWTINPSNDTLDGLITYVCKYAQEYLAVAGLRYRLEVPAELPEASISPEVRHNVFLASKEAVTNVVRHAHATAVRIQLRLEPGVFILEIEDNGRGLAGLDSKAAQSRNGLRNMRKRMEDIGGGFLMGPAPDGGTQIRLTAPIGGR
jgi:ligand-binding sensor domain-containing protein/signal transduction histidine kinase